MQNETPEPVSVVLIVKNCADKLRDCLTSVKPFLLEGDELLIVDTGSTDSGATVQAARDAGATVHERPELNQPGMIDLVKKWCPEVADQMVKESQFNDGFLADFAGARELANSLAKHDIIFWLDSDDTLDGDAALLRKIVAKFFSDRANKAIFMLYDYAFDDDDDGACITNLWRERFVRKSEYVWKGVCHETLCPRQEGPLPFHRVDSDVVRITHRHGRHHVLSDLRNYAILREAWETADWKDPRWAHYLGNACRGLQRYHEAIQWYTVVLRRSGSVEDRLNAAMNIGFAHLLFNRPWKALDWFLQAIKILPADARVYYGIARCYFEIRQWAECVRWTQIGRHVGRPEGLSIADPNHYDVYPLTFESLALSELGMHDEALTVVAQLEQLRPDSESIKEVVQKARATAQRAKVETIVRTAASLAASDEAGFNMVRQIKPEIRKALPILQIETTVGRQERAVTFLCGKAPEEWDHTSVATGIGGSEKMVILLATALAARGYKVDVYGNPRPGNAYKNFDGVVYHPVEAFNPKLPRDIVIVWRGWPILDLPFTARKIFLDLHDVQSPQNVTPTRLARISGAIFKSQFHLEPVQDLLGDKAVVLRNAVDPAHFSKPDWSARDFFKLVYCSSADRGLKRALKIFGRLKSLDQRFSFHWYYGFTRMYCDKAASYPYQFFGDEGCDRHMHDYAEECFQLSDALGAVPHGRVGHQELARDLATASVMLYPTRFPEISCMAVLEAQAAGCLPVASSFGALPESVHKGYLCDPDRDEDFIQGCLKVATSGKDLDEYREDAYAEVCSTYDVARLADDWIKLFDAA